MTHLPFFATAVVLLFLALAPLLRPLLQATSAQPGEPHRPTAWVLAVLLPLAAMGLYALIGTPAALQAAHTSPADRADPAPPAMTPERIQAMVQQLAARLQAQPDDAAGWRMLARSYETLGRPDDAVAAYRELRRLTPDDTAMLLDYAVTLAMSQGRTLSGEPLKLIQDVLQRDPGNLQAHALAGSEAFERRDFSAAITHWQAVLDAVPPGTEMAATVQASIDKAKAAARAR